MKQKEGFELRKISGQEIIVAKGLNNIDFNKIIAMNSSSAFLWKELEGKCFDVNTVADLLSSNYRIDAKTALSDASCIIEQWKGAGLIDD